MLLTRHLAANWLVEAMPSAKDLVETLSISKYINALNVTEGRAPYAAI